MAAAGAEMPAFVQNRCYARLGMGPGRPCILREARDRLSGVFAATANVEVLRIPAIAVSCTHIARTPAQIVSPLPARGHAALTGTSDAEHMKQDLESVNIALPPEVVRGTESLSG